tara:strand:- start:396 stop:1001 length:606 start_codon:yes stop_codon:yes gene_type:complete
MMEINSANELVIAMWMSEDASRVNVTGTPHWFNETCSDSLVVLRLSGAGWSVEESEEFCLTSGGGLYSEYYSMLKVDSQDRIWLFLGSRYSYLANHHRMMRLDGQLNPEFEEFLISSNDPSNTLLFDWEYVSFDPLGNVLVNFYTSSSSLWWDDIYMNRVSNNWNYQSHFFMETAGHTIGGENVIAGEPTTLFGVVGLSAM